MSKHLIYNIQLAKSAVPIVRKLTNFWHFRIQPKSNTGASLHDNATINAYNRSRPLGARNTICYAPFKSLYFSPEGEVYACCYNRTTVLGTYPEHTLKEIWQGSIIESLRTALKDNDLSKGCFLCLTQMKEKTYNTVLARGFDSLPKGKYPSLIEFEMSNTCNLACVMCDGNYSSIIRKEREKLPPLKNPYDDAFLTQLEEFIPHLSKAKFMGGEPFLIPIYYKIWEMIISLNPNCIISVQTNGTIYNKQIESLLKQGNFHISVSVDAISKEVFDNIRLRGIFGKVMNNIKHFRAYCHDRRTHFGIATCPMQQNWHEIPDIVKYCNELKAPIYMNRVSQPLHSTLMSLDSTALTHIHQAYLKVELPAETRIQQRNKVQFMELTEQIANWAEKAKTHEQWLKRLNNMDNEALKSDLFDKLAQYINEADLEQTNPAGVKAAMDKLEHLLSHFSSQDKYRSFLFKLHEFSAEDIVLGINYISDESLLAQFEAYLHNK